MSHAATNWALKQRGLRPVEKLALIHLADCHNGQTGECFPSQQMLADQCEVSRSTMNRVLAALEEVGLISRKPRVNEGTKRQESTLYVLHLDRLNSMSENETRDSEPCVKNDQSRVSKNDDPVCHSCDTLTGKGTGNITGKTREDPQIDLLSEEETPKVDPVEEALTRFYAVFPKRKDGKYSTPAAIRPHLKAAMKKIKVDDLIRCAEVYAASPEHKNCEYALKAEKWLKQEEWQKHLPAPAGEPRKSEVIERAKRQEEEARQRHQEWLLEQAEKKRRREMAHPDLDLALKEMGFDTK